MPFKSSSKGIQMDDDFTIPDGEYTLEIVRVKEGTSKEGGYNQVVVDFKVSGGERDKFPVNYHYVTFKNAGDKGAGMAVKFVKTIGEPWEGDFEVTPTRWIGKKLVAWLEAQEYNGKKNMKLKWVKPLEASTDAASEEQVPF